MEEKKKKPLSGVQKVSMGMWAVEFILVFFTNWFEMSYQRWSDLSIGFYFMGVSESVLSEFASGRFTLLKFSKFLKLLSEVGNRLGEDFGSVSSLSDKMYYLVFIFGFTIVIHLILMLNDISLSGILFLEWVITLGMAVLLNRGMEMSFSPFFYVGAVLPFIASIIAPISDTVNSN